MGLRDCPGGNSGSLCWICLDEWHGVAVLDGNVILPSIVNAGSYSLFSTKKPAAAGEDEGRIMTGNSIAPMVGAVPRSRSMAQSYGR